MKNYAELHRLVEAMWMAVQSQIGFVVTAFALQ
jgi:hypothetical protein